ncbi:Sodium/sulfate symporter [Globomyces pollinis-pini]|nr:Sodium/sulfate symporter [Globomyces pollinis-pini]
METQTQDLFEESQDENSFLIHENQGTVSNSYFWGNLKLEKDQLKLLFCIIIGIIIWNLEIDGLSNSAIQTLAVFISTMLAILMTDHPIALVVAIALVVLVLGKSLDCETVNGDWIECHKCRIKDINGTIPFDCDPYEGGFKTALSGYSQPIVWMILCAFHLGYAVESTLLGKRISLMLMKHMGNHLLGLGFAVFASELLLAPFVPSNTARGGGIILPIVMSLIHTLDSSPTHNQDLGKYLVLCGAHSNLLISSLFITGAAPNPVVVGTAKKLLDIDFTFMTWTIGAFLPGLICGIILPIFFLWMYKPHYDGKHVIIEAKNQLELLGPLSVKELQLCTVLGIALTLWMTGDVTDIPETFVAFMALVALLSLNTISWNEVCNNAKAWDTYFWLAGMLVMAEQLSKLGVSDYLGDHCATLIRHITSSPSAASMLLAFFYFITMFMFSSITGHAVALVGPFLAAGQSIGCSPWLMTAILGYFSSLSACLTPFSTGSVVLYFSQGFFTQTRWVSIGLIVAGIYLSVYLTVGMAWWKLLGYY